MIKTCYAELVINNIRCPGTRVEVAVKHVKDDVFGPTELVAIGPVPFAGKVKILWTLPSDGTVLGEYSNIKTSVFPGDFIVLRPDEDKTVPD